MYRRFLIDENLGRRLKPVLEACFPDISVDDVCRFWEKGVKDIDWLVHARDIRPKPAILTQDFRMTRNPIERRLLKESGLTCFVFTGNCAEMKVDEKVWRILKLWGKITQAGEPDSPRVFEVDLKRGRVRDITDQL